MPPRKKSTFKMTPELEMEYDKLMQTKEKEKMQLEILQNILKEIQKFNKVSPGKKLDIYYKKK